MGAARTARRTTLRTHRKHLAASGALALSADGLIAGSSVASAAALGESEDAGLAACINAQLGAGRPSDQAITAQELGSITPELSCDRREITSLTGLEHATQLTRLFVQHNAITDLGPLNGLTLLTHLGVTGNAVSSLSPLRDMRNLGYLAASSNQLTSLEGLDDLAALTDIGVDENPTLEGRIGPLANKPALRSLRIINTGTTDLTPLAASTGLRTFQANRNMIRSLEGITPDADASHVVNFQSVAGPTLFVPVGATRIIFDVTGHTALHDGTTPATLGGTIVPPGAPEAPIVSLNLAESTTELRYTFEEAVSSFNVFSGTVTLPVVRAEVTSADAATGTALTPFTHEITVTDGFPAAQYALSEDAPEWLSIDPETGVLSGVPPTPGTTVVSFSVIVPAPPTHSGAGPGPLGAAAGTRPMTPCVTGTPRRARRGVP
ncbi:leucine-rich repeat domain-containing protein [Leucobacter chromiireducens]|uniref:Leucine-rich repeat domain-containing protein n=1 Tax=Leucobacter chromiireducens subsp. solipictus TaxID=398235 RepID=A0ABS1SGQ4_9MICO|nr:leucine-rich repeat domain-containing protein [Leucobacter chromiireducens]MBL3679720.1 leucine-rich repeat domain-containing protein [Leucobacter chromiireducens subsp. solipictus]